MKIIERSRRNFQDATLWCVAVVVTLLAFGMPKDAQLAATGYELLTDEKLRESVRADFEQRKGNNQYDCAIPAEQKHPVGLPAYMIKNAHEEMI